MKKFLLFIFTAILLLTTISLGLTSCSDDPCDHVSVDDDGRHIVDIRLTSPVGSWYDETMNEEIRFDSHGTFYDKYCNTLRSAESEGRWEFDDKNQRLTYSYSFNGQNQFADFKVKNVLENEFGFTISSTKVADINLEKIVESYKMEVGSEQEIQFAKSYPVQSYVSNNPRIASVSDDGKIIAKGEKGTTYIKITTDICNVWVKVVVGDDCLDLWYDYCVLLDCNYDQMCNLLGNPDKVFTDNDCYSYILSLHDVVDYVNVFINPLSNVVEQVDMYLKESVPSVQILSYMDSHYYFLSELADSKWFQTSSTLKDSRALVAYYKDKNVVTIAPAEGPWKEFNYLFGQKSETIKKEMTRNGFPYLMTDYSYSSDGSDYYNIPENDVAYLYGLVFNKDKEMCEYWVYLNTSGDANVPYNYLDNEYDYDEGESGNRNSGPFVFYNTNRSVRITFSLEGYVKYECVGMDGPTPILGPWPDYSTALGQTHDNIVEKYGTPIVEDDSGMWYVPVNDYINYLIFRSDAATENIKSVSLIMKDDVETSTVTDYMGSLYNVFENGTASDGSQYAWINGPTLAESTFGVIYYTDNKILQYLSLASTNSVRQFCIPDSNQDIIQIPSFEHPFAGQHKMKFFSNPASKEKMSGNSSLKEKLSNVHVRN